MSYNKTKLAEYLEKIVRNTTTDRTKVNLDEPGSILGGSGSRVEITGRSGKQILGPMNNAAHPTLYINREGVAAKNDFANECLKDREFATRVGSVALSKQLDEILKTLVPNVPSDINYAEVVSKDVLKKLRTSVVRWRVKLPIANLQINDCTKIGNVTFMPRSFGIIENTRMALDHRGPADHAADISGKANVLNFMNDIANQGSAWALTEVDAHSERIVHAATEEVETAVNTVRAFTRVFHSLTAAAAFGLPYEMRAGNTGYIAASDSGIEIKWDRKGSYAPFTINNSVLGHLNEHFNFQNFSRIAGTKWAELNTLEHSLRVATQWLGRSVVATTLADAFTLCAVSLERLLVCDGEETTVEKFADRLAYLLSDDGSEQKVIHKASKRLYGIRSKIVHAGFEAVEIQQRQEIENLALNALIAVANQLQTLDTHEKLRGMLHDKKFS